MFWTVSSLVISRAFSAESQALAGAIFNTVSQLGNSVGLAVTVAIAASITEHDANANSETTGQLCRDTGLPIGPFSVA